MRGDSFHDRNDLLQRHRVFCAPESRDLGSVGDAVVVDKMIGGIVLFASSTSERLAHIGMKLSAARMRWSAARAEKLK